MGYQEAEVMFLTSCLMAGVKEVTEEVRTVTQSTRRSVKLLTTSSVPTAIRNHDVINLNNSSVISLSLSDHLKVT